MSRFLLLALAALAALVALSTIGLYFYERPSVLRVAVPHGGEYQKLLAKLNQEFIREHENIRFRLSPTSDDAAAAKAISDGNADLAVVRSDIAMPDNAETILILAHYSLVVVAPPGKNFNSFSDLKGKTVGVVETEASAGANQNLLGTIEAQYSLVPEEMKSFNVSVGDLPRLLREAKIDAVLAFGLFDSPQILEVVRTVSDSGASAGTPVFVPILEGNALAGKYPGLEASEILRGAFGGSPSRPMANLPTVGATVRLVARTSLDNSTVGDVTRAILANRILVAKTVPIANHIEAPSTDKGEVLPTHPGAAAFLDGEEETFFDKYSDMIYIGAMIGSVIISGLATLASRLAISGYARFDQLIEKALTIMKEGREANDFDSLAQLEIQIDEILTRSLAAAEMPKFDSHQLAALTLAVQQARLAIADRRQELGFHSQMPAPVRTEKSP